MIKLLKKNVLCELFQRNQTSPKPLTHLLPRRIKRRVATNKWEVWVTSGSWKTIRAKTNPSIIIKRTVQYKSVAILAISLLIYKKNFINLQFALNLFFTLTINQWKERTMHGGVLLMRLCTISCTARLFQCALRTGPFCAHYAPWCTSFSVACADILLPLSG